MGNMEEIKISKKKSDILDSYQNSEVIAKKALADFIVKYQKGKGFPLDDRSKTFGIISNCMALSTLLELHSLGAPIKEHHEMVIDLIALIFESIYGKSDRGIFDASPYFFNDGNRNNFVESYVETISKVLISMNDLRIYLLSEELDGITKMVAGHRVILSQEDLIKQVERVVIHCMETLNDSCLKNENPKDFTIGGIQVTRGNLSPKIEYRGWTYCNVDSRENEYGTSLYFTYHASNAYLSVYQVFAIQFDSEYNGKNQDLTGKTVEEINLIEKNNVFFKDNFSVINEFRTKVTQSGRYVETMINENGINLALDYVDKNIQPVSFDNIFNSQKSNDVINTILAMGILINSDVDEDYACLEQQTQFYEQVQFGITNVKKIYSILKKSRREDAIDSYRLLFDEKCPKEQRDAIQEYRKKCESIAVYDYIPLFCNVYSTISLYLIRYPQREMIDNLQLIMDNRMDSKWLWSKEGFDVNNNLYNLFALENFYEYQKEFELPLSKRGERYNEKAQEAERKLQGQIKILEDTKRKYDDLKKQYEDKVSSLDTEVYKIAEKVFTRSIDAAIDDYFEQMLLDGKRFALYIEKERTNDSTFSASEKSYENYPKAKILHTIIASADFQHIASTLGDMNKSSVEAKEKAFDEKIVNNIFKKIDG